MLAYARAAWKVGESARARVYSPIIDERGYKKYLLKTVVESLLEDFPEETREALREI